MNKQKSFLLYNDFQSTLDKLSDAQAANLLRTIYAHVNELDIEIDPVVELVFEPIKQQLLRNTKSWNSKQSQRSAAGKESARKRKESKSIKIQRPLTGVNEINGKC